MKPLLLVDGYNVIGAWDVPKKEHLSIDEARERLVHLIVTVMVVLCELFTVDLVLLHPELGIVPALIMLGLAVLLGFYFWHYFFLENTIQRWYRIAEEMREKVKSG